jgi:cell division protease FtsH
VSRSAKASLMSAGAPGPGAGGGSGIPQLLAGHLGDDPTLLPVVAGSWQPYEHVNVQVAIDEWIAERDVRLVGLSGFRHRMFGLSDLCQPSQPSFDMGMRIGGVAMADQSSGPRDQTYGCVQCGLYLVGGDAPMAFLLRGSDERGPQPDVSLEIIAADRATARETLAEILRLATERSVYRGHVLSFGSEVFGRPRTALQFHERPEMTRDQVILPPGMLEGVERQILAVAEHRETLLAHGQHLKRGVLLYGPPGTGKTHTVRYLMSRLPESTVVVLSGTSLHLIQEACSVARALEPSLVIVEDVDLIAQERGHPMTGGNPLLFQLLNEMDGLGGDADVTFVLTTNRVDALEEALVARPGRIDHAVEVPSPDADGRRRLLDIYKGGLDLELSDPDALITRMEGVTASFIKELLRKASLLAAEEADGDARRVTAGGGTADAAGTLRVTDAHLATALDVLSDSRHRLTRRLLGAPDLLET